MKIIEKGFAIIITNNEIIIIIIEVLMFILRIIYLTN